MANGGYRWEWQARPSAWLRWCDQAGHWLLTDTEQAQQQLEQERQAKEHERQAKEHAQTQVLQAAQKLLATGMALAQVTQILSLSEAQAQALRAPNEN